MITIETTKQLEEKGDGGYKKDNFDFAYIDNKDLIVVNHSLVGVLPATSLNYGVFFIAKKAVSIVYASACWTTASTSGTLNLERLSGTEALGAGDNIFINAMSTAGTANTVNTKNTSDLQNITLKIGDRLALKNSGTLTNLTDLCVTVYLKSITKGNYA